MATSASPSSTDVRHERGTVGYRRLGAAMWCAGLATFVLIYAVQGLLPALAAQFNVAPWVSSLALSATTLTLALAVVPLSAVAESWGRVRVMTAALAASAVLGVLAPLAPSFAVLVAVRALQGVALAALPALAMAHVTREVAPRHLGGAVGLLIAGNTIGGLSGASLHRAWPTSRAGGWRCWPSDCSRWSARRRSGCCSRRRGPTPHGPCACATSAARSGATCATRVSPASSASRSCS